ANCCVFFFQAEDGIRDFHVTGVQTCALPIFGGVGGALIPAVIRRLPEPELEPGEEKVPYPELAAPRWLPWVAAGMGALVCALARSEERRVGREWRAGGWGEDQNREA